MRGKKNHRGRREGRGGRGGGRHDGGRFDVPPSLHQLQVLELLLHQDDGLQLLPGSEGLQLRETLLGHQEGTSAPPGRGGGPAGVSVPPAVTTGAETLAGHLPITGVCVFRTRRRWRVDTTGTRQETASS